MLDAFPLLKEIAEKYKEKIVVISLSVDPEAVWKETEVKESADNWLQLSDGLGMSGIAAHYGYMRFLRLSIFHRKAPS